MKTKRWHLL